MLKHLLQRASGDSLFAARAIGCPERGIKHAQVIPEISHRADRRTWIASDRLLVNRDHRRQPVDEINVRLTQLIYESLRVCRHRSEQSSLSLGVKRVKSQR